MNKKIIRNLIIFAALIAIAFLAKMEAINFFLALPVSVIVMIYSYRLIGKVPQWLTERIDASLPWLLAFLLNLAAEILHLRLSYISLIALAGLFSGYAVYFILNFLTITP